MANTETNANRMRAKTKGRYAYFSGLLPRDVWIVGLVFLLAAVLRFGLAIVNRQANDDHYEVIKLILEGRHGLTMVDCHECFHPKLFYYLCAAVIQVLGLTSEASRIVAGQCLCAAAGMWTLLLVWLVLLRTPVALKPKVESLGDFRYGERTEVESLGDFRYGLKWRLWALALVALNPRLIAINAQLANDSLAILLATGTIYLTLRLLEKPSLGLALASQALLSLALMTKGTTWVVAIAVLIALFVRGLLDESKRRSLRFLGLYLLTIFNCLVSVQLAGYDFERYDTYANLGRGQPLYVWEKTSVGRPGVQSWADGYLTFRIVELLREPQITNDHQNVQPQRTSVWTQLYARANFAQYEQHPASWLTSDARVLQLARASMLLGLLPLLMLLVGLGLGTVRTLKAWRNWGVPQGNRGYASLFCWLVCMGYVAFIIKFTADYRDFAAMKVIYLLPGVLTFGLALLEGMMWMGERLRQLRMVELAVHVALACLVGLYCAGVVALIGQLTVG